MSELKTSKISQLMLDAAKVNTDEAILHDALRELADNEGAPYNNECGQSPFWTIVYKLVTRPLSLFLKAFATQIMPQFWLKYATGDYLKAFGWARDCAINEALPAEGQMQLERVDADSNETLDIAEGTVLSTDVNGETYRLLVTTTAHLPAAENSVLVKIKAEEAGSQYNIAAGLFNIVNTALAGKLKPSQLQDWIITPGRDEESDDNYRLRIRNKFGSLSRWHVDAAYKDIISTFAGVAIDDIYIDHSRERGPASANAYILTTGDDPAGEFFDGINNHIIDEGNHGFGDDLLVMPMPRHELAINYTLVLSNYADAEATIAEVDNYIACAFRALPAEYDHMPVMIAPHTLFTWSQLSTDIHTQFSDVISCDFIGDDNANLMPSTHIYAPTITGAINE